MYIHMNNYSTHIPSIRQCVHADVCLCSHIGPCISLSHLPPLSFPFLPSFLPFLQVLQQQRLERARQMAQSTDPNQPTDTSSFLHSLPPELRRTILSDMDDSLINHLPEEIAREARALRQEREARRRRMLEERQAMYERMMEAARNVPSWGGQPLEPSYRYAVLNLNPREMNLGLGNLREDRLAAMFDQPLHLRWQQGSKQMLDQEGLCCLLVLLFLDQSKLHLNRLFRIFRSLCQHLPTRAWLLSSLFAILNAANVPPLSHTCPLPPPLTPSHDSTHSKMVLSSTPMLLQEHSPHWLNITVSAALGAHAPMFQFSGKGSTPSSIRIHPHASSTICSNILDLLVFLARQFPSAFLPSELLPKETRNLAQLQQQPSGMVSNFWQLLLRLDSSTSRKGKGSTKSFHVPDLGSDRSEAEMFAASPFGQLMKLFGHQVIQSSLSLIDKLIRSLSVIAGTIPKRGLSRAEKGAGASGTRGELGSTDQTDDGPIQGGISGVNHTFSSSLVSVSLLTSAVALLTSGKCTEDCLEDATTFLINLSRCSVATRDSILFILLGGVQEIGQVLCGQITHLLQEVSTNMTSLARRQSSMPSAEDSDEPMATSGNHHASTVPALGTSEGVVLPTLTGAGPVVDHSQDLHLPSMTPLTGKVSQQSFFLRLLKVICQLREAALLFSCKTTPIPGEVHCIIYTHCTSNTHTPRAMYCISDYKSSDKHNPVLVYPEILC